MFGISLNIYKLMLSSNCDLMMIMKLKKLMDNYYLLNGYELVNINRNYINMTIRSGFEKSKLKIKSINLYEKAPQRSINTIKNRQSLFGDVFNDYKVMFNDSFSISRIYEVLALINNY